MTSAKPISLILLVHQEAETIERVVGDFYEKVISPIPGAEFIICEDGSTDGTKDILERIKDKFGLTLFLGSERRGYTGALRHALSKTKHDIVFYSDSDGQHDPADFWKLLPYIDKYDMVVGWKKYRKDGWARNLISRAYNIFIGWRFGVRLHDIDCGFRIMRKGLVQYLLLQNWRLGHCISSELAIRAEYAGFLITEVPVVHLPRLAGESRGLPFKKLPLIIIQILKGLRMMSKDLHTADRKG